jgi:hypothetical protein
VHYQQLGHCNGSLPVCRFRPRFPFAKWQKGNQAATATLAHSYIQQREAFAFLVPKTMIKQRRRWRQQERDKAMRNVFEAQMHARMRRQSLKHAKTREAQSVEADCVTLDLGSARSTVSSHPLGKVGQSEQWVPHSIEEELSSSGSESESFSPLLRDDGRPDDDLVLRVPQPLTLEAKFRLETLGGLDMATNAVEMQRKGVRATTVFPGCCTTRE